ncbi:putative membrane protein [Brevibacterium pityocampae]
MLFVLCYIAWTHVVYARTPRPELVRIAAVQSRHRPSLMSKMFGYGGAGSWTVAGAIVAAVLTVSLARTEMFRSEPLFILLGMATVAASWFAMVYSYALRYLRQHSGGERIDFDQLEPPVFGDYLTMAFMMSTMASTLGARIRTRTGWRAAREHTVLAFVFNIVIVAMTVSLLFGGLTK